MLEAMAMLRLFSIRKPGCTDTFPRADRVQRSERGDLEGKDREVGGDPEEIAILKCKMGCFR